MVAIATNRRVDRPGLDDFVRDRHHSVLLTGRGDGRVQSSLVTSGLGDTGEILISSYPERAKVANIRRRPQVSVVTMSDSFNGEWVHIDGTARIVDLPDALEGLCDYFRVISGDHPDWDEYREAMQRQGKCLIRIEIDDWGPIARGGFPARLASSDEGHDDATR